MQRGFIDSIKKNYKSIKQDIKGANIYKVELLPKNIKIENRKVELNTNIKPSELRLETNIYNKSFYKNYEIHKLIIEKTNVIISNKEINSKCKVNEINIESLKKFEINYKEFKNYNSFYTEVLNTELEGFKTVVLNELVEKTKKSKIRNLKNIKIKEKVINGKDIMCKIPKIFQGRSYIGKKEMLDIAVKVKQSKPDFDFMNYRFLAIFEDLPVNYMKKFKYLDDTKELEFYFDKKGREEIGKMSLVVWSHKHRLSLEKIFI